MRAPYIFVLPLVLACSKPDQKPATPTSASPDPVASVGASGSSDTKPAAAPTVTGKAEIGKPAPDFELSGLGGAKAKLSDHKGKIVVLEWFNPDCPFVKNAHTVGSLKGMAAKMKERYGDDLVWLAINSGAPGKQGHGDETNQKGKDAFGIDYPILYDPEGAVGKAYGATNTPHMYVIDEKGKLVYAGGLDNTMSGDPEDAQPGLINYVANALEDLAAGRAVKTPKSEAWGCSVKYAKR
jgi:peroxiredoxin